MINLTSKKRNTVSILIAIYALHAIGANFAHPITPSYLKHLELPSSMFGYVFAAMSLTNFAFSPFWGVMSRYIKTKDILMLGAFGYALGQAIFGFSSNPFIIILARFISGAFVSAVFVGTGYYVVQHSEAKDKSKNITKMVTVFSVSGTIGYFLGGYLGTSSLRLPFVIQVITLVVAGLLFHFLLEDNEVEESIDWDRVLDSSNPLVKSDRPIQKEFKLLFLTVFLISTASTSLTQTFSYYIVDALDMSSLVNGVTKGLVGLISLILNFTLTLKIVNGRDVEKNIMILFFGISVLMMPMIGLGNVALFFTVLGVIVMSFDTMPVSILQGRTVNYSSDDEQGEMLGIHNAMKSLGMIIGSLVAGWIYEVNIISPFMLTLSLYVVGVILMAIIRKYVKS